MVKKTKGSKHNSQIGLEYPLDGGVSW